jgi:hypothetical protein
MSQDSHRTATAIPVTVRTGVALDRPPLIPARVAAVRAARSSPLHRPLLDTPGARWNLLTERTHR